MRVPFLDPPIQAGDAARLLQALQSGWRVPGPWTEHSGHREGEFPAAEELGRTLVSLVADG